MNVTKFFFLLIVATTIFAACSSNKPAPELPPVQEAPPAIETFRFAVIGDAGYWNESTQQTMESISKFGIQDLIIPGDNLYNTKQTLEEVWKPWSTSGFNYSVVTLGNHNAGYKTETEFFKMPGEFYSKSFGKVARFIVLNSDNKKNVEEQVRFLEKELSAATETNVFIVYHHPSLSVSSFHKWQEKKEFQIAIRKVIFKYRQNITALINGHDHVASFVEFDDLPVFVSGAVHEQRKPEMFDNTQEGHHVKTAWTFDRKPFWLAIEVSSANKMTYLHFINSRRQNIACTVIASKGGIAKAQENCSEKPL